MLPWLGEEESMNNNNNNITSLGVIAVVAALGLLGVVVITVVTITQEAEARGCPITSPAVNASKVRCFRP
jgi:hypothetical protein